jgi:hypothetical protein
MESVREPCSQTPTYDTPATAGKQATAGMLARIPAETGTPAKQGTPAGEGTTSTAKTPATAESVLKSYKSDKKGSQKYCCECVSDKKI